MVGEISNWPLGPHGLKPNGWMRALPIALGLSGAAFALFGSDENPWLLPQVVGCYLNHQHRVAIIVDRNSVLRAEGLTISVTVHDLKPGGARLLPKRRVSFFPDSNRVQATGGDPWYIDTDRYFGSLTVVGAGDTPNIYLVRVPCPFPKNLAAD